MCDYLPILLHLLKPSLQDPCLENCHLLASFCSRISSFPTKEVLKNSSCIAALSCLILATCQSTREVLLRDDFSFVLRHLKLDVNQVENCLLEMETLLFEFLNLPPTSPVTSDQHNSPFKVTHSSTPKGRTKEPFRENSDPNVAKSRRRILDDSSAIESNQNKENNNDSAIGMAMNVTGETCGSSSLSPLASCSSKSSSKNSSPDSGASTTSSKGPFKQIEDSVEEMDQLLKSTLIMPLGKS